MKINDILQTMSALSGIAAIMIGSGWLKSSIRTHLAGSCRIR